MVQSLDNVKNVLEEAQATIKGQNEEFLKAVENADPKDEDNIEINLLLETIRSTESFKIVR